MYELERRAVPSNKYIELEAYDFWDQLGLDEADRENTEKLSEFSMVTRDDTVVVLKSPSLTFKDRLRLIFKGGSVPFECTRHWTVLETEDGPIPRTRAEMLEERRWVIEGTTHKKVTPSLTPKQQSEAASKMVENYERKHSPELIEAVKKLPKSTELLLKLPRELKPEEKTKIRSVVMAMVKGKPVNLKVAL